MWTTANLTVSTSQSFCYDDAEEHCRKYGRLYTWESALRACESLGGGWRLPTSEEWGQLAKQFSGARQDANDDGRAAFEALFTGGRSGFEARLAGNRGVDGGYAGLEAHGFYWTASEIDGRTAWFYNFGRGGKAVSRHTGGDKRMAISVRCVRN